MSDFDDMPMASKMATINRKLDTLLTPFGQHQDDLLARVEKLERTLSSEIDARMDLAQEVRLQATTEPSWTKEQREALKAIMNEKPTEQEWSQQDREAIERIPDERVDDLFKIILTWEQHGKITHINTEAIKRIFEAYKRAGKGGSHAS